MISSIAPVVRAGPLPVVRAGLWLSLAISQMLVVSVLFDFTAGVPGHYNPVFYVTRAARWAAVSVPLFILLAWHQRKELVEHWSTLTGTHPVGRPLAVNLVVFFSLAAASAAFSAHAAASDSPPWHFLPILGGLLLAMAVSQLAVLAPLGRLMAFLGQWRSQVAIAAGTGLAIVALADAALLIWEPLAGATLHLSAAILQLYEADVAVDAVNRTLTIGNFTVLIWDTCSGLEGLALVSGFVSIYLVAFRSELRFPIALVLYPLGIAASFILNSVRIAALTSLGAHVSPEMAVKGFHSQGGWIAFLFVTLGIMALSGRMGLMASPTGKVPVRARPIRFEATTAYLLPFIGLMVGSIAMSAAAPHDRPIYILKAALVALALWLCRGSYTGWQRKISGTAIIAGLLVGAGWIATTPSAALSGEGLGQWLMVIGPELAVAWLMVRGIGTIILVPVAEELAFRGYLYRRIIARDFFAVSPQTLSWTALAISSVLFGILHDRWLAGLLAGAVFGIIMLRTGRLSDAVVAHATANALIFGWALTWKQWGLI
jgi:exosortase E/protease (VPEID-CTERM system)